MTNYGEIMKEDELENKQKVIKILDIAIIVSSIFIITFMFYAAFVLIQPAEPIVTLTILGFGIIIAIGGLVHYFAFARKKIIEEIKNKTS